MWGNIQSTVIFSTVQVELIWIFTMVMSYSNGVMYIGK